MIQLVTFFAGVGDSCNFPGGGFFGIPRWYEYLPGVLAFKDPANPGAGTICTPQLSDLTNTWLIAAAVIEILLRIAALVAVAFVIYGGFNYMTSQGEPDATGRAKGTVVNALIGLAIAVMAAAIVTFIAGRVN
ncbi:MAG TPA: hypothetical protein VM535_02010 [Candidatus Saccharimonadales bacterium]|nr:hypothetical protein [Candidatus Saccharimonadales bacterium]